MSKKTETAAAAAAVVTSSDVMDKVAVTLIHDATASANTANEKARQAARVAWESPAFAAAKGGERAEKLRALYSPELSNDVVRAAFSASLAVLGYGKPIVVAASAIADISGGRIQTKGAQILPKGGTVPKDDKGRALPTRELSASDALAALSKSDLSAAAKFAREETGTARAAGGGRKAGSTNKATAHPRAPFADELSGMLRDAANQKVIRNICEACGFALIPTSKLEELTAKAAELAKLKAAAK